MWNNIKTNEDIRELMECFGEFKKSCICELKYRSGAYVGSVSEHFLNDDMSISVIFQRRSLGFVQTFELLFRDIKTLRLEPLEKGMECYLTAASIKCKNGLVTFSSWEDFDRINADAGVLLISSAALMWRDISEQISITA
ncbi:MAG: hypothetical protein J6O40_03625 [Ruminococcus sp.]|nr:hypothetical protein [Ruminococcus sp.]